MISLRSPENWTNSVLYSLKCYLNVYYLKFDKDKFDTDHQLITMKVKLITLPKGQYLFEDNEPNKGYYSVSEESVSVIEETETNYSRKCLFNQDESIPDNLTVKVSCVGIIRENDNSVEYGVISDELIDIPINKITGSWVKGSGW